ncbi:MAG: response regulator [Candidatus Odinarchaeota archaeon]
MNNGTLMIVEDNREICAFYELLFSINGYSVVCKASNGDEAVEFYRRAREYPEIIVMDYRMPLKDGINTSREILQINPKQVIIFVSADSTIKERAEELGIVQFIEKPFEMDYLLNSLKKALIVARNREISP